MKTRTKTCTYYRNVLKTFSLFFVLLISETNTTCTACLLYFCASFDLAFDNKYKDYNNST